MSAIVQRKGVLVGMMTAVLGVAIAVPFGLVHPVLPFAVLLIGFGMVMALRYWRWLPKYPMAYTTGCLIALIILLPVVSGIKFIEQGFSDGPFYGEPYSESIPEDAVSDRVSYRNGEIVIFNRDANQAPVLAYQTADTTQWAQRMDLGRNSQYQAYQLSSVEAPTVAYGIVRDRVDFIANWSFGTQPGRAYLWKWGGIHRFYLSW